MEEVILVKIESIEKCVRRIEEKLSMESFDMEDYDMQDIIVLNLQRACQQSIDLAMFLVSELSLGIPKDSVGAFGLLKEEGIIDENIFKSMKGMVGFRNVAVHQYQRIDYTIVEIVIKEHLRDFREYTKNLIEKFI
ncbi:MAG: DUF86 domain-containing protein [Psychrilyobacter sp.]|uniref:type VII toxin-antitoxin system HepT family RNase toxin n=1 Tax=Psychrilyobacter sp. TaxID=2586924 RepID=UPI003C73D163